MSQYVAAIDQGTTSTRFIVFDHGGNVIAVDQKEHRQIYPQPGWVEHDALEIWTRTQEVIKGALKVRGLQSADIVAIGITNQRETTVIWDKNTGQPIYNAIVWQDTRTDTIINELAKDGGQDRFRTKTGLPLATYFSGPKIKWILDNVPDARAKAENGELLFGNIDTWIIWNLIGREAHITDVTNASRTMLMNLSTLDWDDEILNMLEIPRAILPRIKSSSEIYGHVGARSLSPQFGWGGPAPTRHSGSRRPWRSTCRFVRSDLFQCRGSQEHVWNRLFHVDEHGRESCNVKGWSAYYPGL